MSFHCAKCDTKLDCRDTRNKVAGEDLFTRRKYKCPKCDLQLVTEERIINFTEDGQWVEESLRKWSDNAKRKYEVWSEQNARWELTSYRAVGMTSLNRLQLKLGKPVVTTPEGKAVRLRKDENA